MKTAVVALLSLGLGVANAAPVTTHVQARLADVSGQPVAGVTEFEVRLFNAPVNGVERFSESFTAAVVNGYVSVDLGADATVLEGALFSEPLWVEVVVDNTPMSARMPLGSAPISAVTQGVVAGPLPTCAAGQEGTVRFDMAQGTLMVCAGTDGWQPVHAGPRITEPTTITVAPSGGDHTTLADAMVWLRGRTIAPQVAVTVFVQAGSYTTERVNLNHPQGSQVAIIGDAATPSNVTLNFSDEAFGMNLSKGFTLGRIDGIRLQGNGTDTDDGLRVGGVLRRLNVEIAGFVNNGLFVSNGTIETGSVTGVGVVGAGVANVGIRLNHGASVVLPGSNLDGFEGNGIRVSDSSTGYFDGSTVNDSGSTSVVVTEGSAMYLSNGVVTNSGLDGIYVGGSASVRAAGVTVTNAANNGLVSYEGSHLFADGASISGSGGNAVLAAWNGFLRVEGAVLNTSASRGVLCTTNATIRGQNVSVQNSGSYGVDARTGCTAWIPGANFSNNPSGNTFVADSVSHIF